MLPTQRLTDADPTPHEAKLRAGLLTRRPDRGRADPNGEASGTRGGPYEPDPITEHPQRSSRRILKGTC